MMEFQLNKGLIHSAERIIGGLNSYRSIDTRGKKLSDEEFLKKLGYRKSSLTRLLALHEGLEDRIRKECPKEIISHLESRNHLPLSLN